MPPELVALGDQLEAATARALRRRRAVRLVVFNALASMLVIVPLVLALGRAQVSSTRSPLATASPAPVLADAIAPDAEIPTDLLRMRPPNAQQIQSYPSSLHIAYQ
jgi:hypothetical protein